MKKLSKRETEQGLAEFFSNFKDKNTRDIKKMLRAAMAHNIKLRGLRKLFCKNCLAVFQTNNSKIKIKKGMKTVLCLQCHYSSRWKMK